MLFKMPPIAGVLKRGRWLFLDVEGLNQVIRKQGELHNANPARQNIKVVLE